MLRWSTVRARNGLDAVPRTVVSSVSSSSSACRSSRSLAACSTQAKPFSHAPPQTDESPALVRRPSRVAQAWDLGGNGSQSSDALRHFFSQRSLSTPKQLRSLYYSAESTSQLTPSDSSLLSDLIALFGTLSVDRPGNLVYQSSFASLVRTSAGHRGYWAFVTRVGAYKIRAGMALGDSDRFWLMRATLAAIVDRSRQQNSDHLFALVRRARNHYHAIRRHSFHPEVHVPYMETLLEVRDTRYTEFLARDLSYALRSHPSCGPRLVQLLYRLVLQFGSALSPQARSSLMSALWMRVQHVRARSKSGSSAQGEMLDATHAAYRLSTALFRSHDFDVDHHPWPLHELCTIFSPTQDLTQRWMSLTLLALFHASEEMVANSLPTNGTLDRLQPPATSSWRVVFGLAILEKLLKRFTDFSSKQTVLVGTLGILHEEWTLGVSTRIVSPDEARAITASFFRLAGIAQEASLVRGCLAFCDARGLWMADTSINSHVFMAAQYLAAVLRLHGPNAEMVLDALGVVSANDQTQCLILAVAIKELSRPNPELSLALHDMAQGWGKNVGTDSVHALALSLARCGILDRAVQFLEDKTVCLSEKQCQVLTSVIARRVLDEYPVRPPPAVLSSLAGAFVAVCRIHRPVTFPKHFDELLVLSCRYGQGSKAVDVVASISRVAPGLLTMSFLSRFCRALLRHRQFKNAVKLVGIVDSLHYGRRLHIQVANAAIRAGALKVAMTIASQLPPSIKTCLWYRKRLHANDSRCKSWRKSVSLRLSSTLRDLCPDDPGFVELLRGLLRSGRVLAAKRIFTGVASTARPDRRTVLANVLLHGVSRQPFPRNGRRVRRVISLIEEMMTEHDVDPDRVTVNILVRTMVDWETVFDNVRLRALFDHLFRSGYRYRAGDNDDEDAMALNGPPPFGTAPLGFVVPVQKTLALEKISSRVDFERHVRPLYKMFIRAFYARGDVEAARKVIGLLKRGERAESVR